jgi:citrate synthase
MSDSSIGSMQNGSYAIRGVAVADLIREGDVVSAIWLTWTGERPTSQIKRLLDACLIACIDHGVDAPSAKLTIEAATSGSALAQSVAAGIQALGPVHGNAAGPAARWISNALKNGKTAKDVVADFESRGERIPGIGHRIYSVDPRTEALFEIAREVVPSAAALDLITEAAKLLSEQKQKQMPVNVDGALGAIIAALGADPDFADMLFIVARAAGLSAHAKESATH